MLHQREPEPTRDEIARCAYGLWQQAGCVHGNDEEHWLEAEAMLRGRRATSLYDVRLLPLEEPGNEVSAVRAIRDATGLELSDIKRLVDRAPSVLMAGVDDRRAESVSTRLWDAGVPVEVVATSD